MIYTKHVHGNWQLPSPNKQELRTRVLPEKGLKPRNPPNKAGNSLGTYRGRNPEENSGPRCYSSKHQVYDPNDFEKSLKLVCQTALRQTKYGFSSPAQTLPLCRGKKPRALNSHSLSNRKGFCMFALPPTIPGESRVAILFITAM